MNRYNSQTRATGGYYFNTSSWKIHAIEGEAGELPGAEGTHWVRLAAPVMVGVALLLSLGFVLFLPAIAFGLFAWVVARGMGRGVKLAAERLARTFAPGWTPGEAYLARRDETPKAERSPETPESLEALRRQVDARRADEKAASKKNG